jgi:hypothetical protein
VAVVVDQDQEQKQVQLVDQVVEELEQVDKRVEQEIHLRQLPLKEIQEDGVPMIVHQQE